MNVSLTPRLEKFVNAKVKSKRYRSASEVVREVLRFLEDHDRNRTQRLADFETALVNAWPPSTAEKESMARSFSKALSATSSS